MFVDAQPNSWQGDLIWPFCMAIAQATIYFIVLSRSSQVPFPCDVAEKYHSAEMLKSIGTMHMSWISGNLNELEDPIAKVNSWYVCGCPTKQLARSPCSYLVILYDYSPSHSLLYCSF